MTRKFFDIDSLKKNSLFLIAGPCVIEDVEMAVKTAKHLKKITDDIGMAFIFKSSFDKANRSSIASYRGPGIIEGLEILQKIKEEACVKIISDIHLPEQAYQASKVLDFIQIPAFLCRQTDLITAAAATGKPVNIKKGQFLAPWECSNIIDKAVSAGCDRISITERGTTFGYNNLVVDFRSISIIREMGVQVIFDATHSVQLPGGAGTSSSGQSRFAPVLARAAVAAGADGVFIETHPDPANALCDGLNSIALHEMKFFLKTLIEIKKALEPFH